MANVRDIIDETIDNEGLPYLLEMIIGSCNDRRTEADNAGDETLAEGWRQVGSKLGEVNRAINAPARVQEPPRRAPPVPEPTLLYRAFHTINHDDFPHRPKARKSRKALFADLQLMASKGIGVKVPSDYKKISNEVYGRNAQCYIYFDSYLERCRGEKALIWMGHPVDRAYSPGNSVTEVGVTYFKGENWDE